MLLQCCADFGIGGWVLSAPRPKGTAVQAQSTKQHGIHVVKLLPYQCPSWPVRSFALGTVHARARFAGLYTSQAGCQLPPPPPPWRREGHAHALTNRQGRWGWVEEGSLQAGNVVPARAHACVCLWQAYIWARRQGMRARQAGRSLQNVAAIGPWRLPLMSRFLSQSLDRSNG